MTRDELQGLLEGVATGGISPLQAQDELCAGPFRLDDSAFAFPDHHRSLRQGLAETVLAEWKRVDDLLTICHSLAEGGVPVLVTRLDSEKSLALLNAFPSGRANERARTFLIHPPHDEPADPNDRFVAVVAAGTSDVPVAEETCEVCLAHGVPVVRFYDMGVAGLHRIATCLPELRRATAVVVIAGMEGALPSVVGGLLDRPIFAVPTSVGYGASFGGLSALLGMLNSCAPGVAVFNIDNGFSAGVAASRVVLVARGSAAAT